jgi:hypothetical protein
MALGDRWNNFWDSWGGNDSDPYEEDPYGVGESYGDAFDYNDPYENLSLDDLLNLDYGDDAGLGSLFGDYDYSDDPWGIGEGYDDAFDFGGDDEDTAFNEFLLNFDFDDPDADWAGGIGDLFGTNIDPDDPYGIGAGYDDAFDSDESYEGLTLDELINLYGTGTGETGETGPLGGKWGPLLRNLFLGSGGTGGNKQGGGIMGLLNSLLGGGGGGGGGLLGGGGLGTLASLWALNKARKEGSDPGAIIPMGQQAYGMDDVYGGPTPDYRVFNIQPALMPGVAYANVGKPEGMKHGGIASLEDPGDVTPAWLEPGEFVMTKKATGNIGAQNLYKMMKDAEGMG